MRCWSFVSCSMLAALAHGIIFDVRFSTGDKSPILDQLRHWHEIDPSFTVIDVGASANPWSLEVIDAVIDKFADQMPAISCFGADAGMANDMSNNWLASFGFSNADAFAAHCCHKDGPEHCFDGVYTRNRCCRAGKPRPPFKAVFSIDISREQSWDHVLKYVEKNGRFSFAIISHVLEDIVNPRLVLEMLPRIAKSGFVAMPSKYSELQMGRENLTYLGVEPYRGAIHHRWIFTHRDGVLHAVPKIPLIDSDPAFDALAEYSADPSLSEINFLWNETIPFHFLNDDYLGPSVAAVVEMMREALLDAEVPVTTNAGVQ